jgi:hypothetical protein
MIAIKTPNATDQMIKCKMTMRQFLSSLETDRKKDKEMNLEEFSGISKSLLDEQR